MAKVNIGLRGWRFEEDEVFDEDGDLLPLGAMPDETATRIRRLTERVTDPCDACWLVFGDEEIERCNVADAIYGEPGGEVVVCRSHERDFVYWFREIADEDVLGTDRVADAFHEWFAEDGPAPRDYAGIEHVDENPDAVPGTQNPHEPLPDLSEEVDELGEEAREALDVDLDDLDL